ncbi:MAG: translation initiation factor IF-2 N-terminal domain-containing protein, partial [Acidimicrobiales bacterium]
MHELSKELGLTSKELLALAQKLGIGASSPSASIEDAQADRIRRRADADGLRREVPAEPVKAGKAEKAEKASKATKATKATKSVASASLEPAAKPEIVEATRAARA